MGTRQHTSVGNQKGAFHLEALYQQSKKNAVYIELQRLWKIDGW